MPMAPSWDNQKCLQIGQMSPGSGMGVTKLPRLRTTALYIPRSTMDKRGEGCKDRGSRLLQRQSNGPGGGGRQQSWGPAACGVRRTQDTQASSFSNQVNGSQEHKGEAKDLRTLCQQTAQRSPRADISDTTFARLAPATSQLSPMVACSFVLPPELQTPIPSLQIFCLGTRSLEIQPASSCRHQSAWRRGQNTALPMTA